MAIALILGALALGGFVLSRTRLARELNARRFMPFVYAAAAVYCGARVYAAFESGTRVWPMAVLGAVFLAAAVDSARASGILRKS